MTQEPPKNNTVLIVIAIIGVIGTIIASVIGAIANYNIEKFRQEAELTKIALISIATQGGATQISMASTILAPTSTPYPTNEPQPTYTSYPTYTPVPLPTIPPTASVSLPFQDDFETGLNANWQMLNGTWRTINNQLAADPSNNLSIITVGDVSWTDYIVDVDVYSYKPAGYPVGVIVRAGKSGYYIFKTDCCDTEWVLVTGTSENVIAHLDDGGLLSRSNDYVKYHIRIEVIGQTLTGYIDGKLYLQVTDPTLTSGKVGVACHYPYDNACKFDNFNATIP